MPDSPDQIICKLQQENKKLKKTLKQKDEELNRERQLWNNRETGWDPSTSTDLHRIEVFDGIISDESSLHCDPVQQGRVPVYFGTGRGVRDCLTCRCFVTTNPGCPGNRCKLRFRHALMSLIRKKDNPTQGTLRRSSGSTRPACAGTSR